jgi:multicomponent Na+:H+ antiporter subunit B
MMTAIDVAILLFLAITAVTIARIRDLWAAVMFTGIYSFLSASWMLLLDAPDVSFTEAAVGAGISTVLMLSTLALTGTTEKAAGSKFRPVPFFVVVLTGCMLIYGTLDMPQIGDPSDPIHIHPSPSFVERTQGDMHGLPNVVTAVLGSYRGYDTLGETTVVLTAGIAVLLILRRGKDDDTIDDPMATEQHGNAAASGDNA